MYMYMYDFSRWFIDHNMMVLNPSIIMYRAIKLSVCLCCIDIEIFIFVYHSIGTSMSGSSLSVTKPVVRMIHMHTV